MTRVSSGLSRKKTVYLKGEVCKIGKKEIAATITLRVVGEPGMFCKGMAILMEGIERDGSLNQAAKSMGMAYSKAWLLAKKTEQNLGIQLIVRNGAYGSSLTKEGAELLSFYKKTVAKTSTAAAKLLDTKSSNGTKQ